MTSENICSAQLPCNPCCNDGQDGCPLPDEYEGYEELSLKQKMRFIAYTQQIIRAIGCKHYIAENGEARE